MSMKKDAGTHNLTRSAQALNSVGAAPLTALLHWIRPSFAPGRMKHGNQ